jgi:hypothetical protein
MRRKDRFHRIARAFFVFAAAGTPGPGSVAFNGKLSRSLPRRAGIQLEPRSKQNESSSPSNISTAEEVGPNPVQTINRDYIEKSGEHTTAQVLRDLPLANAGGVPVSNNAAGFTPGLVGFAPRFAQAEIICRNA